MKNYHSKFNCKHLTIILFVLMFFWSNGYCQIDFSKGGKGSAHVNGKISIYFLVKGGWGISTSFGTWIQYKNSQPSFNMSLNLIGEGSSLGNRNRYLTKYQVNSVLSPMITVGCGTGLFQEISPFYFGTMSSVYSNFRQSLTLGSSFVIMPRGVGRNITTFRNRTQQLVYLGLRGGAQDWDVNFNIYEDFFFTDNGALQGLADNYDRFYTGGGNVQFRLKSFKAKLYSEIYTGNFQRDLFDNPDLYQPYKSIASLSQDQFVGKGLGRRHPRYVSQEPGQKLFNTGRTFLALEFSPKALGIGGKNTLNPSFQTFIGFQGGHGQMGVQNLIHGWTKINKVNLAAHVDPNDLQTNKNTFARLHWFSPSYKNSSIIYGSGLFINSLSN